jgi:F420H(2)-dependent quinone reductase
VLGGGRWGAPIVAAAVATPLLSWGRMLSIRLVTTGARTGGRREVKLYAFEDGARLFVVGSGSAPGDRTPGWVHNLRAQPEAEVHEGKATTLYVATEITEDAERARLWALACAEFRYYAKFQDRRPAPIPIFVLEPVGG